MTDISTDLGYRLAAALQAIDDAEKDFAETRADHKARMETLHKEANRLQYEILTGQKTLPLETIVEKTAEAINEGLLDGGGFTVRATVNHDEGEAMLVRSRLAKGLPVKPELKEKYQ